MNEPYLDQVIVKKLLRYNRKTGFFVWRRRSDVGQWWNSRYAGKRAGYQWSPDGKIIYWVIRIFDYPFYAHRLAVLYVTGRWPPRGVDHRNLDGMNNRWRNLRDATSAQNGANRGLNSNNKTGFKGVCICSKTGKYRASIQISGKWKQLGRFDTARLAGVAYRKVAKQFYGQFARNV